MDHEHVVNAIVCFSHFLRPVLWDPHGTLWPGLCFRGSEHKRVGIVPLGICSGL